LAKHKDVTKNNPERVGDLVQNGHVYLMNIAKTKSIVRFTRWSSSGYICNLGDLVENGEDIFKAWFTNWESGRTGQDETNTGKFNNAILTENILNLDDILSTTKGNPFMKPAKLEKLAKCATELTSLCNTAMQSENLSVKLEYHKAADAFYNSDTCFEFHQFLVATIFRYRHALLELKMRESESEKVPKTASPSNDSTVPKETTALRNAILSAFIYCQQLWAIVHSKAFEDHMSMLDYNKAIKLPTHGHNNYYKRRMAGGPRESRGEDSAGDEDGDVDEDQNEEEHEDENEEDENEEDEDEEDEDENEEDEDENEEDEDENEEDEDENEEDEDENEEEHEDTKGKNKDTKGKAADGVKIKGAAGETSFKWARRLVDHWQAFENVIGFCNGVSFDIEKDVKISLLDVHPPNPSPVMINQETWQNIIHDLKNERGWEDFQDQSFLADLCEWVTNGETQSSIDTPTCISIRKNFKLAFEEKGFLKFQACRHCEAELGSIMVSDGAHPLCHAMKTCCLVCYLSL
jgi:hypothetical protein